MADKDKPKINTRQQELGSKWIFERVLIDNIKYNSVQDITNDKKYLELQLIFDPTFNPKKSKEDPVPMDWLISYFSQQKALLTKFQPNKFKKAKFDRDGGFMQFISDLVKKLGIIKKDAWDPADIWIVNTNKIQNLEKQLNDLILINGKIPVTQSDRAAKIQELNKVLRDLYRQEAIIGVSLKKAGKTAIYVDVNVGKNEAITESEFKAIEKTVFKIESIKCILKKQNLKNLPERYKRMKTDGYAKGTNPQTFLTQEVYMKIQNGTKPPDSYDFYIKGDQTNHFSNLKFEPKERGAGAARLGKSPIDMVLNLLKSYDKSFKNDHTTYAKTFADIKKSELSSAFDILNKTEGCDLGGVSKKDFFINLSDVYSGDPIQAHSKIMQIYFLAEVLSLKENERNKFMTDLIFLAQKKGRTFGPFGKIY
jgi:hypothetical protein